MQKCALYFGSFNPIHIGHIAIAKYSILYKEVDEFNFVLSPQNPIKKEYSNSEDRLNRLKNIVRKINSNNFDFILDKHLINSAEDEQKMIKILSSPLPPSKRIEINDIEFHLPKPLFTYNTLTTLQEIYPNKEYILIIGADNLSIIDRWYKGAKILEEFETWVYPREGFDTIELCKKYGATFLDAPLINISSTQIRENSNLSIYSY